MTTADGIAHGRSDDLCSPDWPDANRLVTRGLMAFTEALRTRRVDVLRVERSIVELERIG